MTITRATITNTSRTTRPIRTINGPIYAGPGFVEELVMDEAEVASIKAGDVPFLQVVSERPFEKAELIVMAFAKLDAGNDDHWTKDGAPSVSAIRDLAGVSVTREEIEAATNAARRPV